MKESALHLWCIFGLALSPNLLAATSTDALPPRSAPELERRVAELRDQSQTWLRQLPKPLPTRPRLCLSGEDWLRKFEFQGLVAPTNALPPAWETPALDESDWERASVPEWNYAEEKPKTGRSYIIWYRKHFSAPVAPPGVRSWLVFDGVDWEAEVFLNGRRLASHQVYFEPFRVDVTEALRATNVLAVRVKSGAAFQEPVAYWTVYPVAQTRDGSPGRYTRDRTKSTANLRNGDTHVGDGCGIHRDVWLEQSGPVLVQQVFVRAADDRGSVRVKVELDSARHAAAQLRVELLPENFSPGKSFVLKTERTFASGSNTVELSLPAPGLQPWSPIEPRLYRCRVTVESGGAAESADALFGARTFALVSDVNASRFPGLPEGMFLLNGQPYFLRGANIQGLNALWLWGEREQLLKVLYYLKAANFNAVRACQHVCFPEVLELMDRLGILSEQDVGCRGLVSPGIAPQLDQAVRALSRMTYNHPGVVLHSFANECSFNPTPFVQASLAEDPSRVLVPISGQFHGGGANPILGRSNFPALPGPLWRNVIGSIHPYWGWYGRVGEIWNLGERYSPGRMFDVGEYGSEALDSYSTMRDHYPTNWNPAPPPDSDTLWGQVQVTKDDIKMRAGFRGRRPATLAEYIVASQNFQTDQLTELTRSWRLSARRVNGYFQFHFMDVLPANWPKSILSHDFAPKPAFFAMAQLNQPVAPLCEISTNGQSARFWIANDLPRSFRDHQLHWTISVSGKSVAHGKDAVQVSPSDATFVGEVGLSAVPAGTDMMRVELELRSPRGQRVARYDQEFFIRAWREQRMIFDVPDSIPNQP